jgi:hypothetical protein
MLSSTRLFFILSIILTGCLAKKLLDSQMNIDDLLAPLGSTRNEQLLEYKYEVNRYIADPYPNFQMSEYTKLLKQHPEFTSAMCRSPPADKREVSWKLCTTHGGNLLEHSQWSALQILEWSKSGNIIMEGVDLTTAVVAAFFHDIGKGGDGIFNIYSNRKYNGQDNNIHPEYSGKMLTGSLPFKRYNLDFASDMKVPDLVHRLFPTINMKEVALAAYMHWEFGRINMYRYDNNKSQAQNDEANKKYQAESITSFYKKFDYHLVLVGLSNVIPSERQRLVKLCIAIGCADISGSSNDRVKGIPTSLPTVYLSKDPWVAYGMDKKTNDYRNAVLARLK